MRANVGGKKAAGTSSHVMYSINFVMYCNTVTVRPDDKN